MWDRLNAAWRAFRESRAHPSNPSQFMLDFWGGRPATSGVRVTEDAALSWTAIWAGVRFLSETMATLPLHIYRPTGKNRRDQLPNHPIARMVRRGPNPEMTWPEWAEVMQAQILLFGHGRSQIIWNNRGEPMELWPLHFDRVVPERDRNDNLVYRITYPTKLGEIGSFGGSTILPANEVLDIRGFSSTGLCGERMVTKFREAIGLGLVTEEFNARFYGQGAKASGFFAHPAQLSEKAKERLEGSVNKQFGDMTNAHRLMILEEGMVWHQLMVDPQKAQALELRKFMVAEAARILRLPPHVLGDLERATHSNIEHQGIELVTFSLLPWAVRWERRIDKQMISDLGEQTGVYSKFNLAGLMRGDLPSRYSAYMQGRQGGWLSANDVRASEDMNPRPGGDTYVELPAGVPAAATAPTQGDEPEGGTDDDHD